MHPSSIENMRQCYERYIMKNSTFSSREILILDIGGADINGEYRDIFSEANHRYLTVDLQEGLGVDIVMQSAYELPFEENIADIVVSGQMLEHCEFFWLIFSEMVRVLKPHGYLFLIAPSAGPIHSYPVDCYRFYPDAYRALAKHAKCHLIDFWLDERGPWHDLVGVFSKVALQPPASDSEKKEISIPFDPVNSPPGSELEETTSGQVHYLTVLANLHEALTPSLYLEIGVRHGHSLALARCPAVGIDPAPQLQENLIKKNAQIFTMTSDEYFTKGHQHKLSQKPDLVFIDGMHLFEYALRDFMQIERLAKPNTLLVIDDIFPSHPAQADRIRSTRVWTGDIWKLHRLLLEIRQDLFILALDTSPSGLLLVAGMDPENNLLWDNYNPIVKQYQKDFPLPQNVMSREVSVDPSHRSVTDFLSALAKERGSSRMTILNKLRALFKVKSNSESSQ